MLACGQSAQREFELIGENTVGCHARRIVEAGLPPTGGKLRVRPDGAKRRRHVAETSERGFRLPHTPTGPTRREHVAAPVVLVNVHAQLCVRHEGRREKTEHDCEKAHQRTHFYLVLARSLM
jgi:hypothetical protein